MPGIVTHPGADGQRNEMPSVFRAIRSAWDEIDALQDELALAVATPSTDTLRWKARASVAERALSQIQELCSTSGSHVQTADVLALLVTEPSE